MLIQNFSVDAGYDQPISVTVQEDLTGVLGIQWVLKATASSGTNLISKDLSSGITITDAANGKFTFTLNASETAALSGSYYHKTEVIDAAGYITPVMSGTLQVDAAGISGPTLGKAKTKALQLINEYSNNGNLISVTANADYLKRMNTLANDVQNDLSDKVGIEAMQEYIQTSDSTMKYVKYDLPDGFKEDRFVRLDDEPFYDYWIENGKFKVRGFISGTLELTYYKYPLEIMDSTSDEYIFELDPNAVLLIPYYLGGMVIADENPPISDKLLNIYYARLEALRKRNNRTQRTILNTAGW